MELRTSARERRASKNGDKDLRDSWHTPTRKAARLAARLLVRGFPRRFGLFEMLALASLESTRRHLVIINELERFRAGRSRISVLDFGGAEGALGRALDLYGLAGRYDVTVADLDVSRTPIRPPIREAVMINPGVPLPFPDASFDVVASSDVFEHIPREQRPRWAADLSRVSRGPQIHTVPSDSEDGRWQSTIADERFAAWYLARFGEPERWTAEHLTAGTPTVEEMAAILRAPARPIVNIDVWLTAMTARYDSTGLLARARFALAYIFRDRQRANRPPFKSAAYVVESHPSGDARAARPGPASQKPGMGKARPRSGR